MKLSDLRPPRGATSSKKRVGRGNGSGWGRTCGVGEKGQKSRSGGGVAPGFEGGQMPIYRRLPKIGFHSLQKVMGTNQYDVVHTGILNRFEDGLELDVETLRAAGLGMSSRCKAGIKILVGSGELTKKLNLKVNAISKGAKEAIEKAGGTVEIV